MQRRHKSFVSIVLGRRIRALVRVLVFLGMLTAPAEIQAIQRDSTLAQLIHEKWQTDEGLPQNAVYCLAQDLDGFLWFGTENGLVRFDGVEFKVFTEASDPAVPHNFVSSLLVASDGAIWAGTRTGGLCVYRGGKFHPVADLASRDIYGLAETKEGIIWAATDQGLARIADGKVEMLGIDDGLPEEELRALYAEHSGALWIGTKSGRVSRLVEGKFVNFGIRHLQHPSPVKSIAGDPNTGDIWVAHDTGGVFQLSDGAFTKVEFTTSGAEASIQWLYRDSVGALWIGTQKEGLVRYYEGKSSQFRTQEGLPDDDVLAIMRDREGSIWIGTHYGGLNRLRQGKVVTSTTREGLPVEGVSCIVQDEDETLWVGTLGGGLVRYSDHEFTPIPLDSDPESPRMDVRALLVDRAGDIWAGTHGGGLAIYQKNGDLRFLTTADGLLEEYITALLQRRNGEIWIGTTKRGLNRYNPATGALDALTEPPFLQRYIRALAEDSQGRVWVGTQDGLVKYEDGAISQLRFSETDELSIRSLLLDPDDTLWIGSRDDGLLRLRDGQMVQFDSRVGLLHHRIYHLLRAGNDLWLAGNLGLERVPVASLEAVADGREKQFRTQLFTEREGLRTSECGGDSTPSGVVAGDGRLYFGTRRGLAMIDPGHSGGPGLPPNVLIMGLAIDNQKFPAANFHRLAAGATRLQIDYTALALRNPANVFFKYKMDPVDPDWVDAGRIREAVYYNLRPGSYTFRVKACNDEGLWNETGAVMGFYVAPHFYQTPWFYFASSLAGISSIFGAYRWRVASIRGRNTELATLVAARTRELQGEVVQRKGAEEKLRELNEDLEERVKARTSELRRAYESLEIELHDRQEAEQALARSEARLRRIVDSGMVGILFWNRDGGISDANGTFLRMVGYSREDMEEGRLTWPQITPPEFLERDAAALEEIKRNGICTPFEKEYIRKDGTRFPVLLGGASLSAEGDKGVCFILDITRNKATEEEIRRLNHSLEARVQERTLELARMNEQLGAEVQERKRVAIALAAFSHLGQQLHSARTESEAAAIVAQSAKSLIPHDACTIELYGPDDRLYPVIAEAAPSNLEPEALRSSISVPIRNGSRVVGIVGLKRSRPDGFTANDANTLQALGDYCGGALERIHAGEARRETERRFSTFMKNAPALAWMKDAQFRYVFTNEVFQKFAGLSGAEIEGKTDYELWPEAVAARMRANDLHTVEQQSKLESEERLRRGDGQIRTLLTLRFLFTTASGEQFVAGMAIDITEQKKAEEALHRLPQSILDAQEKERRRVARELHDGVNQAIASIKFRIQTAEQQILRSDPKWQETSARAKLMLDAVLQQVRRLSRNLRPGELDDFGLIPAARLACQDFEARTGITVHFEPPDLEERLPAPVELSLYRIMQEALTNVERHAAATAVDIRVCVEEGYVTLEIADNGHGLEPERLRDGRGLGLLHMRERASLISGLFSISTAPGEGVRLTIHAPLESSKGLG